MNGCRNKSAVRKFHFQIAPQWHIWGNQSRTSSSTPHSTLVLGVPRQSENFSAATFPHFHCERERTRQCLCEWDRQTKRERVSGRESFHCFSYDSFHVLIPLRLLCSATFCIIWHDKFARCAPRNQLGVPHQGVCQGRVACHSEGTARF